MNGLENIVEVTRQSSCIHRFSDKEAAAIYGHIAHNSMALQKKTTCAFLPIFFAYCKRILIFHSILVKLLHFVAC